MKRRWVVVDVETSGPDPTRCRVISVAALALDTTGAIDQSVVSFLNPGVDPGPTHIHGITTDMLAGQPRFAEIAGGLADLLRGRTLVAHNAAFDYAFLAAEARRAGTVLPVESVLCTVELARRLELDVENVKLATLARHWGIQQARPHDAYDDAFVLSQVLLQELSCAHEHAVPVPIRAPHTLRQPAFSRGHKPARLPRGTTAPTFAA